MSDSYNVYNAVFTATYNVNRRKNKRPLKLWRKASVRKADMEVVQNNYRSIMEIEKSEGKTWIEEIYKANGLPAPRKGGRNSGGLHIERKDNGEQQRI